MLINLYDENLNYIKTIPEERISEEELFHKAISLYVYDNKRDLILQLILNIEQSKSYKEIVETYFVEEYKLNSISDSQILLDHIETIKNSKEYIGNVFNYVVEVYLNKSQTKHIIEGNI